MRLWWWICGEIAWLDQFVKRWTLRSIFIGGHLMVPVLACYALVWASSRHRNFDSVNDLPVRNVGIVLGCSKKSGSHDNPVFQARVKAATDLFKAGKVHYLVVSGDGVSDRSNETKDLKEALVAEGVPADHIYPDYAGFRTLDSVLRAHDIFGQSDFTIISQKSHNERALYIAKRNGLDDTIAFNAASASTTAIKMYVREVFARISAVVEVEFLRKQPRFLGSRMLIGPTTPPVDDLPKGLAAAVKE